MSREESKPNYDLYSSASASIAQLKKSQVELQKFKGKLPKLTTSAISADKLEQGARQNIFSQTGSSRTRLTGELITEIDSHCRNTEILIKRFEQLRDKNYSFGNAVYDKCTIS